MDSKRQWFAELEDRISDIMRDVLADGISICHGDQRVDPADFYNPPEDPQPQ